MTNWPLIDDFGGIKPISVDVDKWQEQIVSGALPRNLCIAADLSEVEGILPRDKNILVYFWRPSRALLTDIAVRPFAGLPTLEQVWATQGPQLPVEDSEDPIIRRLKGELWPLLTRLVQVAKAQTVTVSLSKVTNQICPLFHTDRVHVRLLCTLRGPGTEWLDDASVRRMGLGKFDNSKVVRDGATIYQLAPYTIGLFKGEAFPRARGRGIVHRSPAVDPVTGPRWFLRLDTTV